MPWRLKTDQNRSVGIYVQVVSISSLKGGVGKTSVTLGLASAALAAGVPTLVVDLDPHADATTGLGVHTGKHQDIGRMLESPRRARLADHVTASAWVGQASQQREEPAVLDVASGSAYSGIFDRPDLSRRDLRRLTTVLSGLDASETAPYELVLIDCPPSLNGLTRMAWMASEHVLLVAEPGLFSIAGTERTLRAIELFRQEIAPELSPVGVVANRVRNGSAEHDYRLEEMSSMFGSLLLTPTLPERANWQQIQGAARSVHQWPGETAQAAAADFDALLQQILAEGR